MTTNKPSHTSKVRVNEKYIAQARAEGREHILVLELPFPTAVRRCPSVLAVEGCKAYLRTNITTYRSGK